LTPVGARGSLNHMHPTPLPLYIACLVVVGLACNQDATVADPPTTVDPAPEAPGHETPPTVEEAEEAPLDDHRADDDRVRLGDDPCTEDSDCVPAQCCHAHACVARDNAPDCADAMCTMECRGGTIDCGGGCVCMDGRCAARLNDLGAQAPTR
jgi:hypothetical protein